MSDNTLQFLAELEAIIRERQTGNSEASYTAELFQRGRPRIAQKVGEEGVEVAIAAVTGSKDEVISESADLVYHLLVLLAERDLSLLDVCQALEERHRES